MNVVGSVVGPTVLRVRAELDDGSQLSATTSVSFATPTGLHVACNAALVGGYPSGVPYGQCGGLYPVFTDSSWRWTWTFDSDAGPLPVYGPSIAVQGSAVTYDGSSDSFQSGSADGTAEVVIASRLFAENVPVRVVSTADVVSGEARLVTFSDGIEQPLAQVGPAPSTLWYPQEYGRFEGDNGSVGIMPLLTLADGSQVYGGGGLFASDHPRDLHRQRAFYGRQRHPEDVPGPALHRGRRRHVFGDRRRGLDHLAGDVGDSARRPIGGRPATRTVTSGEAAGNESFGPRAAVDGRARR